MTARSIQHRRDKQRGINRTPHQYFTNIKKSDSETKSRVNTVSASFSNMTSNYEHLQNLHQLASMFEKQLAQV